MRLAGTGIGGFVTSEIPFPATPVDQVRWWLEQVVVALNLCPFAGGPLRDGRIRIVASEAKTAASLLADLESELIRLENTASESLETTLVVITEWLQNFNDYNQFLDEVDWLLAQRDWEGVFQVASFHPQYQFAETEPADAGNLTNRAPWPILHLLREDSVGAALQDTADPEAIPARNICRMESLNADERRRLFPWLNRAD